MNDRRLNHIRNMIRSLKEEAIANSVGGVAGLTGEPPVNLIKKKRPTIIARGLMPGARKRWNSGVK